MDKLSAKINRSIRTFANQEDGAQVIEYALIIAVVSIALVVALHNVVTDTSFTGFITRVGNCLTAGQVCA